MGLSCFQLNILPIIIDDGADQDNSSINYHTFTSHIIIDQDPYDRIMDRTGYSSSYLLNGLILLSFSLLGWIIYYIFDKLNNEKI
jgi:hypothetical protein